MAVSYGVRKAGGKEPVTADTIFEAASLGKPVLAYAILRLHDEGGIDLDRPLLEYMPYADVGAEPRAKLVTARHVLSHRTGLPNWRSNGALAFEFTPGERFGDYARFMTRSMPRSSRDRHDLSESTRRGMLTPHSPPNRAVSYGLGWSLEQESGAASFWHSGFNRGFKNVALADAEGRIGVVLLTNSNEGDRLRWPIVHDFTGRGGAALL